MICDLTNDTIVLLTCYLVFQDLLFTGWFPLWPFLICQVLNDWNNIQNFFFIPKAILVFQFFLYNLLFISPRTIKNCRAWYGTGWSSLALFLSRVLSPVKRESNTNYFVGMQIHFYVVFCIIQTTRYVTDFK